MAQIPPHNLTSTAPFTVPGDTTLVGAITEVDFGSPAAKLGRNDSTAAMPLLLFPAPSSQDVSYTISGLSFKLSRGDVLYQVGGSAGLFLIFG